MKLNLFFFITSYFMKIHYALKSRQNHKTMRVVAVGDLHGGFTTALYTFALAGVTDSKGHWIGGNFTTLIQTGDVIDRGDDTVKLYSWFIKLREEAELAGGKFIPLLGNHEIYNLQENYKDVSDKDIQSFTSKEKRILEFSKQGWIGQYLRGLSMAVKVNDMIFVHGGISLEWANKYESLDELNLKVRRHFEDDNTSEELKKRKLFNKKEDGPLFNRNYAKMDEEEICEDLIKVLEKFGAKKMIMGHTIIKNHKIKSRCDNRAIFIDVAISSYYDGGHPAAIEFTGNNSAKEIYPPNE